MQPASQTLVLASFWPKQPRSNRCAVQVNEHTHKVGDWSACLSLSSAFCGGIDLRRVERRHLQHHIEHEAARRADRDPPSRRPKRRITIRPTDLEASSTLKTAIIAIAMGLQLLWQRSK